MTRRLGMPRLGDLLTTAILTPAILTTVLAGCADPGDMGQDANPTESSTATPTDPTPTDPTQSPESTEPTTNDSAWTQLRIINITSAGGAVRPRLSPLQTPAQIDSFTRQLASPAAGQRVRKVIDRVQVPSGQRLMGAVVALGCEPPTEVTVQTDVAGRPRISAEVAPVNVQCFAAITSVALVSVRADLVR